MEATTPIRSPENLVTSPEQERAGFVEFALEKSKYSAPLVMEAKTLKCLASKAKTPEGLINIPDIRSGLLTASGLSDKSLRHLYEKDKDKAISNLIENHLKPAGNLFLDELVYRFLIVKGDSMGGKMRNIIGEIAEQKLIHALLSNLSIMNIRYKLYGKTMSYWSDWIDRKKTVDSSIKAIHWRYKANDRVLGFNLKIPVVNKNVDICLFDSDPSTYNGGDIVKENKRIIMLGELKGGIDPAGADEHWKTGNTALGRIRSSFKSKGISMKTSFIAAAIQRSMAEEIFNQLKSGVLDYAANLTIDEQLVNYCNWIIKL